MPENFHFTSNIGFNLTVKLKQLHMSRHHLAGIFVLIFSVLTAQNTDDVFQYNRTDLNGTARYIATAGTISNIGADLSAVSDNPAAAAVFVSNRISWSPGVFSRANTSVYNGRSELSTTNSIFHKPFYTGQFGAVFPFVSDANDWNKIAMGITYKHDFNYLNEIQMKGTSGAMQSVTDYFVAQAEGVPTGDLRIYDDETVNGVYTWLGENYGSYAQQAFLAYQAYLINPLSNDDNNTNYTSAASYAEPLKHKLNERISGKKTSTDIFFAAQYKNKLSLGVSLTFKYLNSDKNDKFVEHGYDASSTLQYVEYRNQLHTEADGFQMKLGMIYRVNDKLNISFAYRTPVWWEVEETTRESLYAEALDIDDLDNDGNTSEVNVFDINPEVDNVFGAYKYISPGSWQAGISYIVGKIGFISVDYGRRNWKMTHFSAVDKDDVSQDYYDYLNDVVDETFTVSQQLRVGGELKLQEWAVRAGYYITTSPFEANKDEQKTGLTFGMGYDFGNMELDFGMHFANETYSKQLFPVGLTQKFDVNTYASHYVMTLRFNF